MRRRLGSPPLPQLDRNSVVAVKRMVQRSGEARWVGVFRVLRFLQKNNMAVGRRQRKTWPELPVLRAVHVTPSGEERMTPLSPTVTNWPLP